MRTGRSFDGNFVLAGWALDQVSHMFLLMLLFCNVCCPNDCYRWKSLVCQIGTLHQKDRHTFPKNSITRKNKHELDLVLKRVEVTTSSDDLSYFLLFWNVTTILQHFLFCKWQGIQECLHWRFPIAILPLCGRDSLYFCSHSSKSFCSISMNS